MNHPQTMLRLAEDRRKAFEAEARRERLVRELSSATDGRRRERFSVRDLRWSLLRPAGA